MRAAYPPGAQSSTRLPPIHTRCCGDRTDPHPGIADLVAYFRANYNRDIARDCWIPEIDRPLFVSA
ncbi:hypothetical protein [Nocardia grenadensis]|uniref:hypothetical protein n=1 Tax=Nocardia grenadensis TaxID=931537 RepID=UPI0007A3DA73|nr:hypothetical protein [Nocardia grenadensis]